MSKTLLEQEKAKNKINKTEIIFFIFFDKKVFKKTKVLA
jgi:hypothetical protein